jgi:hypothetical protein
MRPFLLVALLPAALGAAATLQLVKPVVSQSEGGDADPPGFEHVAGETLYFTCRVDGFMKSEDKVHLTTSVQAFDPRGVALADVDNNAILEQVSAQDKDWQPKVESTVEIPPLAPAGEYKILIKVKDYYSDASAELPVTFRVRGARVEPSDRLVVRNFGFYRAQEGGQVVATPIFHDGSTLYARWVITGYKYGENNKVDINWTVSILSGDKVLKSFDTAADQSEGTFYPKPWVEGEFDVPLQKVLPGAYVLLIRVKDVTGKQEIESRHQFTVE